MHRFEDYVELSRQATSVEGLKKLYAETVESEGYENLIFTSVRGGEVEQLHWLQFPDGYPEYYFENAWDTIDPILACALRARRPFLWNDAVNEGELSKPQINLLNECNDIGVYSGIAFPFHGPGNQLDILSISRRTAEAANEESLGLIHSISTQTWTRFLELTEESRFPKAEDIALTAREIEVLHWAKSGKSYSDIAEILAISRKTIEFHMSNAMNKLGASNKISAVVIAIHRGIIDI